MFKKVTIVGVGLLGGSIGLALKKKRLAGKVTGFFRHKEKIKHAVKIGAVDEGTNDLKTAIRGSDFIILCSPVCDIIHRLKEIKSLGCAGALITDTGSAKLEIVKAARGLNFIGSHPIAGSDQSGIDFAEGGLFKNALCVLTPTGCEPLKSLEAVRRFWKALGAKPVTLRPDAHDNILAFASHLPHALAFSLMAAIPGEMLKFSGNGLKDTTRIALSSPEIWTDIFLSNKKGVLRSIASFERSLKDLKKTLAQDNRQRLLSLLQKSRSKRRGLELKP